jgi:hypothetical protein
MEGGDEEYNENGDDKGDVGRTDVNVNDDDKDMEVVAEVAGALKKPSTFRSSDF